MEKEMKKLLLVVFLILATSVLATNRTKSASASTCSGSSCDGLDPYTTGCADDASVVASATIYDSYDTPLGTIYYMWSPTCQVGYGHTVADDTTRFMTAQIVGGTTLTNHANNVSEIVSPLLSADSSSSLHACGAIRIGAVNSGGQGIGDNCAFP